MVKKEYDWLNREVELLPHTERKLKILDDYLFQYLIIRCQLPKQTKFRLAIVDGFAGGGRYKDGKPGSPIIFIESIEKAINAINANRVRKGLNEIEIECLLIFNDSAPGVIQLLKNNCQPVLAAAKENTPKLHLQTVFLEQSFKEAYDTIRKYIEAGKYPNVLFNLDQCGTTHIHMGTIHKIMNMAVSVEIFYTFMAGSFFTFLQKTQPDKVAKQLKFLDISEDEVSKLYGGKNNDQWMGAVERLVFENFFQFSRYLSPFSINNPEGWSYWLIHFANNYRAREAYNMVLHENATAQAHFGRSGLDMLRYDPRDDIGAQPYLFDLSGRKVSRMQLVDDIPEFMKKQGGAIGIEGLYEGIYNTTPAHRDEIHGAIMDNPDLEVITSKGGKRKKANTISTKDTLILKPQKSFFSIFPKTSKD